MRRLCRFDALLIDEIGYLTVKPEQVNAFFKLMEERYTRKKSTTITTNLAYPHGTTSLRETTSSTPS